jgi:hypothetical protein
MAWMGVPKEFSDGYKLALAEETYKERALEAAWWHKNHEHQSGDCASCKRYNALLMKAFGTTDIKFLDIPEYPDVSP